MCTMYNNQNKNLPSTRSTLKVYFPRVFYTPLSALENKGTAHSK